MNMYLSSVQATSQRYVSMMYRPPLTDMYLSIFIFRVTFIGETKCPSTCLDHLSLRSGEAHQGFQRPEGMLHGWY